MKNNSKQKTCGKTSPCVYVCVCVRVRVTGQEESTGLQGQPAQATVLPIPHKKTEIHAEPRTESSAWDQGHSERQVAANCPHWAVPTREGFFISPITQGLQGPSKLGQKPPFSYHEATDLLGSKACQDLIPDDSTSCSPVS